MPESSVNTQSPSQHTSPRAWIGYVIPMILFAALTSLEGVSSLGLPYPVLYTFKVICVTVGLYMSRKVWKDIRIDRKMILPGFLIGVVVFVEWIVVDKVTPHFLGKRTAFNPNQAISSVSLRWLFIAIRFYGLVLMVPLMEELFWRSFLIRWITDQDFLQVAMDGFSWSAFAMVAGAFALSHPEWLAAAICAVLYGVLLKKTGSLFACFVAHATTNLVLGIYIMATDAWSLW